MGVCISSLLKRGRGHDGCRSHAPVTMERVGGIGTTGRVGIGLESRVAELLEADARRVEAHDGVLAYQLECPASLLVTVPAFRGVRERLEKADQWWKQASAKSLTG